MFLEFYGLSEQPFGVTPDPRFLYMGPAQQEAFASLLYGVEMGRGFMALIARPGLGKTTILMKLLERLQASTRTAFLFQAYSTSEEFLRSLLADLEIQSASHDLGEMQQQLGDALLEEAHSGKRIVVAVDEAQNLDDQVLETVRMLSNFETPQFKLLQVILVGQPQLADKLASPQLEQLRQRVSIITHFPPFGDHDIPKYIDHRMRTAGYRGGRLFTPAALDLIVEQSRGIPRNVNNLCFQALSLGYAKNRKIIDEAIMREVIADLNLETLGGSYRASSESTGLKSGVEVGDWKEKIKAGPSIEPTRLTGAPGPAPNERYSTIDAVNLSSGQAVAETDSPCRAWNFDVGKVPVVQSRKHLIQPVVWVGLATLLAYLWMGPGLKSSFDSLGLLVGHGRVSSNSAELETASKPAVSSANPTGAQTYPPVGVPGSDSKALPPETGSDNQVVPDPESASTAGAVNNHPALPEDHSVPALGSTTPATRVPPSGTTADEGSMAGNCRLIVESSTDSARISLNGKSDPHWVTPHLFTLAAGTYLVSVYKGEFLTWTKRIHIDERRETWLMADLKNNEDGIFTVDTDPPGMQVFVDGKEIGQSRVETTLAPGWHVCTVIPGPGLKPLLERFHLQPGEVLTRRIRLEKPSTSNLQRLEESASRLSANQQGGALE